MDIWGMIIGGTVALNCLMADGESRFSIVIDKGEKTVTTSESQHPPMKLNFVRLHWISFSREDEEKGHVFGDLNPITGEGQIESYRPYAKREYLTEKFTCEKAEPLL